MGFIQFNNNVLVHLSLESWKKIIYKIVDHLSPLNLEELNSHINNKYDI